MSSPFLFIHNVFLINPSSSSPSSSSFLRRHPRPVPKLKPQLRVHCHIATKLSLDSENTESKPKLSPDELLAAFEETIDGLEKDLDSSSDTSSRREQHERNVQKHRQKHIRRLDILTSLPAELVIESPSHKCSGCGISLQSASPAQPGFLPPQILTQLSDNHEHEQTDNSKKSIQQEAPICQRCYRLTHYGELDPRLRVLTKNAAVLTARFNKSQQSKSPKKQKDEEDFVKSPELTPAMFRKCLQKLQSLNVVVIYLVDIFDFHGSFIPALRDIVGTKNPIILALNKTDLLPPDYKQSRVQMWIQRECRSLRMQNVDAVHFISSLRGTGVATLLADAIRLARKRRADIYVVGAANVGKSSFINRLIKRQRSRGALGKMQTAQVHIEKDDEDEEGVENVDNEIANVLDELDDDDDDDDDNDNDDDRNIKTTKENEKQRKSKKESSKDTLTTSVIPGTTLDVVKIPLGNNINLFDTPGLMVTHQLTNLLSEKDLRSVVPSKSVEKVTFRLGSNKALYIGGLARIELVEGRPFFFTCFFSREVKVHPGRTENADEFVRKHVGKMLAPPSSLEGYERLGEWTSKSFNVNGDGWKRSCVDVVLSGLGWISITGAGSGVIKVWVPKNVGVFTREPLMPFEIREGVSAYTGGRAINKKQMLRKKKRRGDDDGDDDFDSSMYF